MHLPPLDMLREPPSLSPDERSPLWSPDSGPVTPADGVQVYFAAKDLVPSPDNEDADRANAPESRRMSPSERNIKGRAKSMLFQLNKSVSALSLRSGAGSTKSGVFLPVELQERQASSSASPLGVGCHSLQSTQPGPTSSNFGRSNFMRSFAAFPPPPYLSERNDVSTPATAPATPPSSSSHSRVNDGTKAAGDFQLGEDKEAQGQFQDASQQPAGDAKGTVTLSPSALAFPGDLALDFKLPSTGTSAPGSAPPANPTIRPNPSSPSDTPIMHASFVSPSIMDFRTPDATMAHPEKTAGLELLFQDDFSSASASASAGMDLPLDVRCSPTPPPTVHQNADIVSEVAVIGREDAGEIPEEVEVVVEQESTIVDRTPSFPMNNRRLSSLGDATVSSVEPISAHDDIDATQTMSAFYSTAGSSFLSMNKLTRMSFPTSNPSIEMCATAEDYVFAPLTVSQDSLAGAEGDAMHGVDAVSTDVAIGSGDGIIMAPFPSTDDASDQHEEGEEGEPIASDSVMFILDTVLVLSSPSTTPANAVARAQFQDPNSSTALLTESAAPWKELSTRSWTWDDIMRVMLFIPWCAVVGAAICLHPRVVGGLVFRTPPSRFQQPAANESWMLLLPRTQAPASPVQRLAHHAHTVQAQVACFASILIVVAWVFPATGLGISLGVGARTLRVWGTFNMEKTVRKAIAEARADGGGMGWMDMACVGAVLGGLEEEFVCALAAEGQ